MTLELSEVKLSLLLPGLILMKGVQYMCGPVWFGLTGCIEATVRSILGLMEF